MATFFLAVLTLSPEEKFEQGQCLDLLQDISSRGPGGISKLMNMNIISPHLIKVTLN